LHKNIIKYSALLLSMATSDYPPPVSKHLVHHTSKLKNCFNAIIIMYFVQQIKGLTFTKMLCN